MIDAASIERSARALVEASPSGSQVILFGSRAKGTAGAKSDIDFLVIQPRTPARLAEAARLARVVRPMRMPVDIVVVGREEFDAWKDEPGNLFHHAHREGRRLA